MNFSCPHPPACGSAAVLSSMKSDAYATIAACSIGSSGSVPTARSQRSWSAALGSVRAHVGVPTKRISMGWSLRHSAALRSSCSGRRHCGRGLTGRSSGPGTSGIGSLCVGPSSATWNDAAMLKIARPCWMATTRRVTKLRPSRMRSTSKTIGVSGSPGRRKNAWSECTGMSSSTVRPAATSACASTWPPNTRVRPSSMLTPRNRFTSRSSRSSMSTRSSRAVPILAPTYLSNMCPSRGLYDTGATHAREWLTRRRRWPPRRARGRPSSARGTASSIGTRSTYCTA